MDCVIITYETVIGAKQQLLHSLSSDFVTVGMYMHTELGVELHCYSWTDWLMQQCICCCNL
jgi:hypothetical protein